MLMITGVADIYVMAERCKNFDVEFSNELKKYGLRDWNDVGNGLDYIVKVGESSYAIPVCKNFFSVGVIIKEGEKNGQFNT